MVQQGDVWLLVVTIFLNIMVVVIRLRKNRSVSDVQPDVYSSVYLSISGAAGDRGCQLCPGKARDWNPRGQCALLIQAAVLPGLRWGQGHHCVHLKQVLPWQWPRGKGKSPTSAAPARFKTNHLNMRIKFRHKHTLNMYFYFILLSFFF